MRRLRPESMLKGTSWLRRASLILLTLVVSSSVLAQSRDWEMLATRDGIRSYSREATDFPLPAFRSETIMQHGLWHLLAILEDVDRAAEWTAHCREMKKLKTIGPRTMLVYGRMQAPWPVRDRDVVVRVAVQRAGPSEVFVDIRNTAFAGAPSLSDVVRMPRMRASYRFRSLGPTRTLVTYQLQVDPGGSLPDWLKRLVARNLPHDTLERLRERAAWAYERGLYRARAEQLRHVATTEDHSG